MSQFVTLPKIIKPRPELNQNGAIAYMPMQLVVPRAVRIAVAIDAMICNAHLSVSFLVIIQIFKGLKI